MPTLSTSSPFGLLRKAQMRALRVIAAVTFAAVGIAGGTQAFQQHQTGAADAAQTSQVNFWRLVAGKSDSLPGTKTLLARDLRALDTAEAQSSFVAPANRYGGVVREIGFDPFAGGASGCTECGPLTDSALQTLAEVNSGNIDQVVDRLSPAETETGLTLTPAGIPAVAALALWATAAGGVSLALAHRRLKMVAGYPARSLSDLPWDQPSTDRNVVAGLGWSVAVPIMVAQKFSAGKFTQKVQERFPEQASLLDEVQAAIDRYGLKPGNEIVAARDRIRLELESQVRHGLSDTDNDLEMLAARLEESEAWMKMRADAAKEFDGNSRTGHGAKPHRQTDPPQPYAQGG